MSQRMMCLGAFFNYTGHHVASWRHPRGQADGGVNFAHYVELAQTAERNCFHVMFLADSVGVREAAIEALSRSAQYIANFEPITLLSAIAAVTKHIGLVATASTSYNEPFHVARKFASLDFISGGRAAWNMVTSVQESEARNFNRASHFSHAERYERAHEFAEVVCKLWDSWDDDAFPRDKASGLFFKPEGMHPINHVGKYFQVAGPLNIPRSPQGHPVLVQAGASEAGMDFAARFAEAIFANALNLAQAQDYYKTTKARVAAYGRNPDHTLVLPGISPILGGTEAEARRNNEELEELTHPIVAREILATVLGVTNLADYDMDAKVPTDLKRLPNVGQSTHANWMKVAREEDLTIRQLALRVAAGRGKSLIIGTPEQIADHMQAWFEQGGADGFNIQAPYQPGAFNDFCEQVVPLLQKRGIFRREYQGTTLRENLGLPRPTPATWHLPERLRQAAE